MSAPLLCIPGMFVLVAGAEASLHLIGDSEHAQYWDGHALAEKPESYAYLIRQTFKVAADIALPIPNLQAAAWYVEHYTGPAMDKVRGIAACILTGTCFGHREDGGSLVDKPEPDPTKPLVPGQLIPAEAIA